MAKQVTLTDRQTSEIIYPITSTDSVYNKNNKSVDELIKKCYDKEIFASLENIPSIAKALNSNKIEIYHDT